MYYFLYTALTASLLAPHFIPPLATALKKVPFCFFWGGLCKSTIKSPNGSLFLNAHIRLKYAPLENRTLDDSTALYQSLGNGVRDNAVLFLNFLFYGLPRQQRLPRNDERREVDCHALKGSQCGGLCISVVIIVKLLLYVLLFVHRSRNFFLLRKVGKSLPT